MKILKNGLAIIFIQNVGKIILKMKFKNNHIKSGNGSRNRTLCIICSLV